MENCTVEVFRTNVRQQKQAKALLKALTVQFPLAEINFDLEDRDKVLRVKGPAICIETVISFVTVHGYDCAVLDA